MEGSQKKDYRRVEDKIPYLTEIASLLGLRCASDLRTVTFLAIYFGLSYYAWINFETLSNLSLLTLFLLICHFSFTGAVITHNTMHCSLFKRENVKRNKVFQMILSLSYGHPVSSYVPGHNMSHHRYTQLLKDHMRTSKVNYRHNGLNLLFFQPTVAMAMLKGDIRYILVQKTLGRNFFYQSLREFIFVIGVSLSLLYMNPLKFFILFYVPHFYAQWLIVGFNILQHDGCDIKPAGTKKGNITRNFVDPISNYLLLNNGYHGIHHIRPDLHWSFLEEYHDRECAPTIHENLDQKNILAYCFTTFIYPAKRLTYDGKPVVFDEKSEGPDEEWLKLPPSVTWDDVKFSTHAKNFLKFIPLLIVKALIPMYSPITKIL
eukprot:TRINITY_DN4799_c0_g1_i1.p1 TRINITY_DN4799_c0_g1~~TRINITY_DN4799_c0_g1_i1.p1  ORF type:complete len:375 (-),score=37.06 TRINITY_DN4799_c0_g1_i1:24-1148(-)